MEGTVKPKPPPVPPKHTKRNDPGTINDPTKTRIDSSNTLLELTLVLKYGISLEEAEKALLNQVQNPRKWIEEEWCKMQLALMNKVENSDRMLPVDFNSLPSKDLREALTIGGGNLDEAADYFIIEWKSQVDSLLSSLDFPLTDNMINYASRTLSALDCNKELAKIYLLENYLTSNRETNHKEQVCEVCLDSFPPGKIFGLPCCQCVICNDCTYKYFALAIQENRVVDFVCPICREPDINSDTAHFQILEAKLKVLLLVDDFIFYQRRITEWNLTKNPSFRWCVNPGCHNGFLIPSDAQKKVQCTVCYSYMCHECRKPWEQDHENRSCEKFMEWKQLSDPLFQAQKQLEENGIECPHCKRRYLLAKGGCLHFTCAYCHHEFCCVCSQPFKRSCMKTKDCERAGLHCHHPRNCLYYLRDKPVSSLQQILEVNKVSYDTNNVSSDFVCPILEQKETTNGSFVDELCNGITTAGHAGLCDVHYKEYLVDLIRKNSIQP